jgi:hypothetical protein
MFTKEIFNIILQELKKKGIVSVTDLVKMLDVSKLEKVRFATFGVIADSTLITTKIYHNNISYDTNVIEVIQND